MHKTNLNRITFHSAHDMLNCKNLIKAEKILQADLIESLGDINDILELYHIKLFFDHELYLNDWSSEDISSFNSKVNGYSNLVGKFITKINDENFNTFYTQLEGQYIDSFWELINNQKAYKRISHEKISEVLANEPHTIRELLTKKNLVNYYGNSIRRFLLEYALSAEIILSIYVAEEDTYSRKINLPKCLTLEDKEYIIKKYIDYEDANPGYIQIIPFAKDSKGFRLNIRTKLKAKKRIDKEIEAHISDGQNISPLDVKVGFRKNMKKIIDSRSINQSLEYYYSSDFIEKNNDTHSLFRNFIFLFAFIDNNGRIDLISKPIDLLLMERIAGIRTHDEYIIGVSFHLKEMTSLAQITTYRSFLDELGLPLEQVLEKIFTYVFKEEYDFDGNATLKLPSVNITFLEKVRILAPEFESVLRQYNLFVEDGYINRDLLEFSSTPQKIGDILSLNKNTYLYLNTEKNDAQNCTNLLFSSQTLLGYVERFKDKNYRNLFELIIEEQVNYSDFANFQKPKIEYLIEKELIFIDKKNIIQIKNLKRICILKDLYENEVASFYHYESDFKIEAKKMESENLLYFESTLFSKPEQNYFNYYLNKSKSSNGLDLRNRYSHGTQPNPDKVNEHELAYYNYLRLLVLTLLKIENDLIISKLYKK